MQSLLAYFIDGFLIFLRFRYWIMSKLLPGGKLCGVTTLVGTHYEMVSIIYRLLGAKVIFLSCSCVVN